MGNILTALRATKVLGSVPKLIGKSKNGFTVYRETLGNGNIVTRSFKDDKLYKTIIQSPTARYVEPGFGWCKPNAPTFLQRTTSVENHLTGENIRLCNSYRDNGRLLDHVVTRNEETRALRLCNGKLIEDTVSIYQPNGGNLVVRHKPYISDRPTYVVANGYRMPNGKVVNGKWGSDTYGFFRGQPQEYSIKVGDKFYSGNDRSMIGR